MHRPRRFLTSIEAAADAVFHSSADIHVQYMKNLSGARRAVSLRLVS